MTATPRTDSLAQISDNWIAFMQLARQLERENAALHAKANALPQVPEYMRQIVHDLVSRSTDPKNQYDMAEGIILAFNNWLNAQAKSNAPTSAQPTFKRETPLPLHLKNVDATPVSAERVREIAADISDGFDNLTTDQVVMIYNAINEALGRSE